MGPRQVFIWFSYHQACFDFHELSGHNPSVILGERKCRRSEMRAAQAGAARGSRTGKCLQGLCRTPKNYPLQRLSPWSPSQAPSLWHELASQGFTHVCSFFPEEDEWGESGRQTKPPSSIWPGWGASFGLCWAHVGWSLHQLPFDSCSSGQLKFRQLVVQKYRWVKRNRPFLCAV